VRSVALLYWLASSLVVQSAVAVPYALWRVVPPEERNTLIIVTAGAVCLVMAVLFVAAAWYVQRLSNIGQFLGAIAALGGLLMFPIGTIVGSLVLWILLGTKGKVVFSQSYRAAVAATPNLDFRPSKLAVRLTVGFIVFSVVSGLALLAVSIAMEAHPSRSGEANSSSAPAVSDATTKPDEAEDPALAAPTWAEQEATFRFFKDPQRYSIAAIDEDLIEQWKLPIDPHNPPPRKKRCLKPTVTDPESAAVRKKCDSRFNACYRLRRACAQDGLCEMKRIRCVRRAWGSTDCCLNQPDGPREPKDPTDVGAN
jgi:hypothetical protein